jgi:molybdopterin-binding protein
VAARSGSLTTLISHQAAEGVHGQKLKIVLPKYEPAPRPVQLVYRGNMRVPLKLEVDTVPGTLLARITAEAGEELALVPGKQAWAIVKAHQL